MNGPMSSGAAPQVPADFEDAQSDPLNTGSAPALHLAVAGESQSTLKLEDLIPEWRGPAKSRKG